MGFAKSVRKHGPATRPIDERAHFAYDADNRSLGESKPMKMSLRPGDLIFSSWQLNVPTKPGIYRVGVMRGSDAAWRGYFTVGP